MVNKRCCGVVCVTMMNVKQIDESVPGRCVEGQSGAPVIVVVC